MTSAESMASHLIDPECSVVLLIDLQERVMRAIPDAASVLTQAALLADVARVLDIPMLVAEQNPRGLGHSIQAIADRAQHTIATTSFDVCADGGADLLHDLRPGVERLDVIVGGCETHIGVLHSAIGLRDLGARVWVAADACGARSALSHELAADRMRQVGVSVSTVETVSYGWLRTAHHPKFRSVQALVKAAALPTRARR